jgi:hypothetical protein
MAPSPVGSSCNGGEVPCLRDPGRVNHAHNSAGPAQASNEQSQGIEAAVNLDWPGGAEVLGGQTPRVCSGHSLT